MTEGEKTADAVQQLFPAWAVTTPMHGAKSPSKTDWAVAKGRKVTIWPDHDQPGIGFGCAVAELATVAGALSVAVVDVPAEFPAGRDLADPPPGAWTVEQLQALLEAAPAWSPEAASAERLAKPRRPSIRVEGGDLAKAVEESLAVLASEPDPHQAVYVRGNLLMRPTRVRDPLNAGALCRPEDALILRVVDADWLRLRLSQMADFFVETRDGVALVNLPVDICRCVLAASPWQGLPTLTGIIEAPTILPDGRMIQTPGGSPRQRRHRERRWWWRTPLAMSMNSATLN